MGPIAYVDRLNEMYRSQGFPPYRWSEYDSTPWTPTEKPLNQSCVALISSAGVFREDQQPFDPWAVNDLSFREIPKDTPPDALRLNHNYFDHRDALKDLNCVFPLWRLHDLERSGQIGKLAPVAISLGMGRLYKRTALQQETVPRILEVLKGKSVDAALLVAA
jgi:D-proline reductase (dithiol) PrdB